jgi:hypothetical protein
MSIREDDAPRIVEKGKRPIFPLRPPRLPRDPQCGLATDQANAALIGPGESRPLNPLASKQRYSCTSRGFASGRAKALTFCARGRHNPEVLFSTIDGLFLWDQALNTERLVPKAALERAFTSGTTNDGTPVGYGFGWYTNVFPYLSDTERKQLLALGGPGLRHVAHGGSLITYYNFMLRLFDSRHDHGADQSRTHRAGLGPK